jgi:hypothetical protein
MECIIRDPDEQPGLRENEMYGVYLSWCLLNQKQPASDRDFRAAMRSRDTTGVTTRPAGTLAQVSV